MGRLFRIQDSETGQTNFVYDGTALIAEYNASGALIRRHVHGDHPVLDDPLITYEGTSRSSNNAQLHYTDPRGSVVLSAKRSAAQATNSYDEFGIPGEDNAGRFQFTGQVWIPEIGMYYYKARMYSPTLGRFLQPDPIGYGDGLNIYNYVGGDPVNNVDPTGLVRRTVQNGIVYVYNCVGVGENVKCQWTAEGRFVSRKDLSEAAGVLGLLGIGEGATDISPCSADGFTIGIGGSALALLPGIPSRSTPNGKGHTLSARLTLPTNPTLRNPLRGAQFSVNYANTNVHGSGAFLGAGGALEAGYGSIAQPGPSESRTGGIIAGAAYKGGATAGSEFVRVQTQSGC